MTADELLRTSLPNKRTELIRGVLVVHEPPGYRHGRVSTELAVLLANHVKALGLGEIVIGDTGFHIAHDPDTVRGPDIAFITTARAPAPDTQGFPAMAPDLVVEVLSPHDRPGETLGRVGDWLEAGARLVWVIAPAQRRARVYRGDGTGADIREGERLDGEDVLPGFTCPLAAVL
jgi:Uma2 family endonuclease